MSDVLLILHLELSSRQLATLTKLGLAQSQAASWNKARIKETGLKKLFFQAELVSKLDCELISVSVEVEGSPSSLREYFAVFVKTCIDKYALIPETMEKNFSALVFNLMPFHLGTSLVDKIVQGTYAALSLLPKLKDVQLIYLTRNIDWFTKSVALKQMLEFKHFPSPVAVVDYRGFLYLLDEGQDEVVKEVIPRSTFHEILQFQDSSFYHALIYETNRFLGHFALQNSHVRTHYDLYEFVERDDVLDALNIEFTKLIETYDTVMILGVGLEHGTINRLGYFLKTSHTAKVLRYELILNAHLNESDIRDLLKNVDVIVILSDIVNSGATLAAVVDKLKRMNLSGTSIEIFTIARMANSPNNIKNIRINSSLIINRTYYSTNQDKCPLCDMRQPLHKIKTAEDFKFVDPVQLTPYDFWEIVYDCKAFPEPEDGKDPQGRKLLHQFNTMPVIEKYKNWLRNVVKSKFESTWPTYRPNVLCTVKEDPGREHPGEFFAELVAQALDIDYDYIQSISRDDLRKATPSGLPPDMKYTFKGRDVLIVDDGINRGETMKSLIHFCRAAGVRPMGSLVFDNRLNEVETRALSNLMGGEPIVALYNWVSPPIEV